MLVLSAAGLPGSGRWGENSEASLVFCQAGAASQGWQWLLRLPHPQFGPWRACPGRDMAWREACGLRHPRREPRSQNRSWSGVNGGPEKVASTSREPGPLDGRDEGQPLPELVGWADSGGSGPGVNTRALCGARPGWGQGRCPAWGPAASPRSPSTDLLGSGALGLEEGWESPRSWAGDLLGPWVSGSQGHAGDPCLLGVQPWQAEDCLWGNLGRFQGGGWGALPWARAAHVGFPASQKGLYLQSVGWGG